MYSSLLTETLMSNSHCKIFYWVSNYVQVSTPDQTFIFDFYAFASHRPMNLFSPSKGKKVALTPLQEEARVVLKSLFTNPRIIKVGWAFNNCDMDMLSKAGNGTIINLK